MLNQSKILTDEIDRVIYDRAMLEQHSMRQAMWAAVERYAERVHGYHFESPAKLITAAQLDQREPRGVVGR